MSDVTPCLKRCRKCGEVKSLEGFALEKRGKYGRSSQCKTCRTTYAAGWYASQRGDANFKARRKEQSVRAMKKWRAENSEAIKLYMAAYREANKEQLAEQGRKWAAANPDAVRRKLETRRARKINAFVAPVTFSEIWERDSGVCGLCDEPVDPEIAWPHPLSKTLDHVVPLARGGTHEPSNVQIAHAVCNFRKGDRLI